MSRESLIRTSDTVCISSVLLTHCNTVHEKTLIETPTGTCLADEPTIDTSMLTTHQPDHIRTKPAGRVDYVGIAKRSHHQDACVSTNIPDRIERSHRSVPTVCLFGLFGTTTSTEGYKTLGSLSIRSRPWHRVSGTVVVKERGAFIQSNPPPSNPSHIYGVLYCDQVRIK